MFCAATESGSGIANNNGFQSCGKICKVIDELFYQPFLKYIMASQRNSLSVNIFRYPR